MHAVRGAAVLLLPLVVGCLPSKEVRSAGEVGCSPDEVAVSQESYDFGLIHSYQTWTATCRDRTYVCSHRDPYDRHGSLVDLFEKRVSCTEEPESTEEMQNRQRYVAAQNRAAAPPLGAAPDGAAGFEFGFTSRQARDACEAAGHVWTTESAHEGACSGPVKALGIPASVALRFCDDRACRISLEHRPAGEWSRSVVSLKANLVSKYGQPTERTRGIPVDCRSEAQFERCLETRALELNYRWTWPSGALLEMDVGRPEHGDRASIRLRYRRGGDPVLQSGL